jgi:hypothetical protein
MLPNASCTVIQSDGTAVNGQITACVAASLDAIVENTSPVRVLSQKVRVAQDDEQSTSTG